MHFFLGALRVKLTNSERVYQLLISSLFKCMNQFIMVDVFKEGIMKWTLISWLCQEPGDLALNCFQKRLIMMTLLNS